MKSPLPTNTIKKDLNIKIFDDGIELDFQKYSFIDACKIFFGIMCQKKIIIHAKVNIQ